MTVTTAERPRPLAPALFVLTVFTGAALVFMVEPMMAKLVLPLLGGSAAVWNTSLAFFQAALLGGYVYAHLLQRVGSIRRQITIHLVLLIAAAFVLPLKVSGLLGDPPSDAPALWLLGVLGLSIGAPFAILSATAPLVQAWHARLFHAEDGREPYALYAASNLGSLIALLAYPALMEPLLTVHAQTLSWSLGYGVFFLVIATLGASIWRSAAAAAPTVVEAGPPVTVTWLQRLIWIALAALPSSLMLGVTTFITTDVGSAPFLWVVPLALYLLTFVIAFQTRPLIPPRVALLLGAAAAALCAATIHGWTGSFIRTAAIHLVSFFFVALICHQALVARRPAPQRLTDFYICMSLGGVIGGAFNAFLAPVMFNTVVEYPAVVVLAALARPWGQGSPRWWQWAASAAALVAAVIAVMLTHPIPAVQGFVDKIENGGDVQLLGIYFLAFIAFMVFLLQRRSWMYASSLLVLVIAAERVTDRVDVLHNWRGFFGVVRSSHMMSPRLGGELKMLAHGTTLHGAQAQSPAYRCRPLVYYAPETPIGQVFLAKDAQKGALNIGAVGLGTGTVAAYVRQADNLKFFEIDPLIFRISTNPKNFSYTSECAKHAPAFVLGDARLTLNREPAGLYDILLIDAFSSDSVPAHLLTVEAVKMYLTKIKPDGVIILHLSNRNLDLVRPAEAVALAAGGKPMLQEHQEDPTMPDLWESAEEAVIVGKSDAALALFRDNPCWSPVTQPEVRAWTDDYTNLPGALWRRSQEKWGVIKPPLTRKLEGRHCLSR